MKISVIGCGYVGLAVAAALAYSHNVSIWDKDVDKLNSLKKGNMPINDESLKVWGNQFGFRLNVSDSFELAVSDVRIIFLALPTDYNFDSGTLDTSTLDTTFEKLHKMILDDVTIIIKSTVPIGYTQRIQRKYERMKIMYIPEFLREGRALFDCQNPDRLVIGGDYNAIEGILECFCGERTRIIRTSTNEAEAIKLLSNAYLAMRVAFFNEVDCLSMEHGIDSKKVIDGICLDSRIGDVYNVPSAGYGGYCLPKDTKQILSSFPERKSSLFSGIIQSNEYRKRYIANILIKYDAMEIGVNRLSFKAGTTSCRGSVVIDIINMVLENSKKIIYIYDPDIEENNVIWKENRIIRVKSYEELNRVCSIILTGQKAYHGGLKIKTKPGDTSGL